MDGRLGLKNDVAANLVDFSVTLIAAEYRRQIASINTARDLHASTSSRTRCKRNRVGAGRSK